MKYKTNIVLVVVLLISCVVIAGLTVDKQRVVDELAKNQETIMQLRNDNAELSKRLYETMTTKISTASRVIETQKETLKMDSEDQCKAKADKYFTDVESLNGTNNRNTYRSHWNTNLKACLIEITIRETKADGSVGTKGILSYDLTNNKKIMVCSNDGPTENAKSCSDSIFTGFEDMFMSQ